jgi:hypothetical protein
MFLLDFLVTSLYGACGAEVPSEEIRLAKLETAIALRLKLTKQRINNLQKIDKHTLNDQNAINAF